MYLTESDDVSSPIHLRLEVYPIDDHPEYETVSYAWGGENADSTLCKPVYIGSFWDIILTTSNCSDLLHYLRSRKVCRVIWLDAICINQTNKIEKSAQISRMGDIYSDCERVIVYFGKDLIQEPRGRLFRPRVEFQKLKTDVESELEDSDSISMDVESEDADFILSCSRFANLDQYRFLQRRYLARIWVVQELVLAKKAVIPLGDSDVLCGRDEAMRLVLRAQGRQLDAFDTRGSLSYLLTATSHCRSSDPRDRVYGLLGLFRPQDVSRILDSDDSLSWRDCWLGVGAYIVLVEKNLILLTHAVTNQYAPYLPSWVPDLQRASAWFDDDLDLIPTIPHHEQQRAKEPSSPWKTEFVLYSVNEENVEKRWCDSSEWGDSENRRLVHPGILYSMDVEQALLDSTNGALQLQALRVFDGPCQLTTETEENGLTKVSAHGSSTTACFRVMGLKSTLDMDESYQLFIIANHNFEDESFFLKR